ncbi:aldo/keto reductase [Adhaeribacter sp. BT258]|uniref:Aldo/keto reductase n=1 Tax=Adhaeribacter terrigena TaxID=2793070 RepID=A0ABS1C3P6_9BACT|nr:aldo/keto reductase [Adhaeribacter terrigena]MBK0403776.1 aldo/keto reductase [Adhaeribacter terrigena]
MPETRYLKKLAIGTVQFGLNYGISNQSGQSSFEAVCEILKEAQNLGIDTLDTAAAYGNSETILGEALTRTGTQFTIVTKVSGQEESLQKTVGNSLEKLKTTTVYGCLFHDYNSWKQQPQLLDELQNLKAEGKIHKLGFSLYYPQQAEELLEKNVPFDLVQVPYSLFDQRFETVFKKLKKVGVEIHTRSVFLQGLFFLGPGKTNPYFQEILPQIAAVKAFAAQQNIPLNLLLLGFAALNLNIDKVVIGVENTSQLKQNAAFVKYLPQIEKLYPEMQKFALQKEEFLLPFNWKL